MKFKNLLLFTVIICSFLSCKKYCPPEVNLIKDTRIDWPTFKFNNQHTGFVPVNMNIFGNVKQMPQNAGSVDAGLLVDATKVYAAGHTKLYAFDKFTYQTKWSFTTFGNKIIFGTPAIDNGAIYFGSNDSTLYVLNTDNGSIKWFNTFDNVIGTGVIVDDKNVYFGNENKRIYAFNKSSGVIQWSYLADNEIWSTPTLEGNILYFTSSSGNVYALNKANGNYLWNYQLPGEVWDFASPVIDGNILYIASMDHKLYALDKTDGHFLWSFTTPDKLHCTPAVDDHNIYFGSFDEFVYALDKITGEFKWKFNVGVKSHNGLFVDNANVYVIGDEEFYILDKFSGESKKQISIPQGLVYNGLATDGKALYFAFISGKIFVME